MADEKNPNSNDPGYMNESFQAALARLKNTVSGQSANDVSFFAETNRHPNPSSNDQQWRDEQFEQARRRFGGR
jgi:hypothetical protein